ncbi:MAG: L,D-transpeptidase family protein [Methylomonas sp.]|jgi:murein L,D-transpeptidase YcbB/YkuD
MKLHTRTRISHRLRKSSPHLLSAILALYFFSKPAICESSNTGVSRAITALLANKHHPLLRHADFSAQSAELEKLYKSYGMQPIWLGKARPEKNLNDALAVLTHADADGLNPANYDAEQIQHFVGETINAEIDAQTTASYDLAVSVSLLRFAHDLCKGRIDPRLFKYPEIFAIKPEPDILALIKANVDRQTVNELPVVLAPKMKQYQLLKEALNFYRRQTEATQHPMLEFSSALHPGDHNPQLPDLRLRLQEIGLLTAEQPAGADPADTLYDEATKAAVISLQLRQGLNPDGFIGKQTLALLNQTVKQKITLIELAMERLRWLPRLPDGRQIIVNIPAFQLWALNSPEDENPLSMKVVVGKAKDYQTPILFEEMKYLEFMPYWNIPRSIMDKEIVPKLQTNAGFLSSQNIELVDKNNAEEEESEDYGVIGNLKHGLVRARQLPGKKNPLGKVKFIFPNKADVYLHDTPFRGAFNRDRRDLSHGCVRVAEAEKLAEFVLGNQQGWDKQSIQQAMTGTKTKRVSLKKSIPVLFFYSTAFAGQDNKLRFYPDIYGYDEQLQAALNKSANQPLIGKPNTTDG